jgi:CBS domain-containing protein
VAERATAGTLAGQNVRQTQAKENAMKVRDAMVKTPVFCSLETNLGGAVEIMWKCNGGILPIIDAQRRVTGVITDRDIAIAMGTRSRLPAEINVAEAGTRKVHSCKPTDDVRWALDIMGENKVRRLVVVNEQNQLEGVLSMDDVVLYAETNPSGSADISADDILRTLKALYSPQLSARTAGAEH